jgi:hypothetical protein
VQLDNERMLNLLQHILLILRVRHLRLRNNSR